MKDLKMIIVFMRSIMYVGMLRMNNIMHCSVLPICIFMIFSNEDYGDSMEEDFYEMEILIALCNFCMCRARVGLLKIYAYLVGDRVFYI